MLAILFMVSMWNYVDRQIISVLVTPIKAEFHASDTQMGLLTGFAFAASYAIFGLPAARLADRGDRRLVVSGAVIIWSGFTTCCGLVSSFPLLVLARLGVGVGEAGAIPPAQSLIADYFAPGQRARALAVFMSSAMFGTLLAFGIGGRIAAAHGWRSAFIALGLPGLLIALLAAIGLKEPRRMAQAGTSASTEPLGESLRALLAKRSYIYLTIAMVLYFMVAYGAVSWFPAYLGRTLHMGLALIGSSYGTSIGIASFVGTLLGGGLTDRLGRQDGRWFGRAPALMLLVALPAFFVGLLSASTGAFIAAAAIGTAALYGAVPGMFALLHATCGSPRRALAVAVLFFFANLIGLGLGPLLTGALSDHFAAAHDADGLGHALMLSCCALLPAGLALWRAGALGLAERED